MPPIVHWAKSPFHAECGEDLANQHTTDLRERVTCRACLQCGHGFTNRGLCPTCTPSKMICRNSRPDGAGYVECPLPHGHGGPCMNFTDAQLIVEFERRSLVSPRAKSNEAYRINIIVEQRDRAERLLKESWGRINGVLRRFGMPEGVDAISWMEQQLETRAAVGVVFSGMRAGKNATAHIADILARHGPKGMDFDGLMRWLEGRLKEVEDLRARLDHNEKP